MRDIFATLSIGALAVAMLALMLSIVAQVVFSAFDVNPVLAFGAEVPLLGRAVTLNTLLDLQWHLLVLAGLLPAGLVWLMDGHVRVDFLYRRVTDRARARVDLIGNIVFAAPFLALSLPAAWTFLMRAWTSDEASRNNGLNDLWLIKSVLPAGLALLALAVLIETLRLLRAAR